MLSPWVFWFQPYIVIQAQDYDIIMTSPFGMTSSFPRIETLQVHVSVYEQTYRVSLDISHSAETSATMTSSEGMFCSDAARQMARLTLMHTHPVPHDCASSVRIALCPWGVVCQRAACRDPGVVNSSSQGIYGLCEMDIAFVSVGLAASAALALFYRRLYVTRVWGL